MLNSYSTCGIFLLIIVIVVNLVLYLPVVKQNYALVDAFCNKTYGTDYEGIIKADADIGCIINDTYVFPKRSEVE